MAVKKIQCGEADCKGIIAHQLSDKTFELKRQDQGVTMTGESWSSMATCPLNPEHQTSIVVTEGKVDTSVLRYREESEGDHDDGAGNEDQSS